MFGGVSLLLLSLAVFQFVNTHNFIKHAQVTSGKVVDLIESYDEDGGSTYAPIFVFESHKGEQSVFSSSNYSYPPAYDLNEVVEVYYNPDDLKDVKISGYFSLWGGATVTGVLGLLFGLALIFLLWVFNKPDEVK